MLVVRDYFTALRESVADNVWICLSAIPALGAGEWRHTVGLAAHTQIVTLRLAVAAITDQRPGKLHHVCAGVISLHARGGFNLQITGPATAGADMERCAFVLRLHANRPPATITYVTHVGALQVIKIFLSQRAQVYLCVRFSQCVRLTTIRWPQEHRCSR